MFILLPKTNWLTVEQSDINQDSDFYISLDKTWSLLELKIEMNAVRNRKAWLDVFYWLEDILIKKIRDRNSSLDNKDDRFLILLFFVQRSIENLLDDDGLDNSKYTIDALDDMMKNLSKLNDNTDDTDNKKTRGVWFWSNANLDWGSFNVIWDYDKEEEVIFDLQKYNIDRVYGSYGRSISADGDEVGDWNTKLHDVWIKSDLLIWSSFLSAINDKDKFFLNIQDRFLDFNESRWDNDEKLDDIHLDLEPHGMDNRWDLSLDEKKWYLYELLDLYVDLRDYLDDNDGSYADIYVDLPHWFSNIGSIWWNDEKERDDRFLDIGKVVDGITLMTYENTKLDTLLRWAEDENNLLWDKIKLSLDTDIGWNNTWDSLGEYLDMVDYEC